MSEVNGTRWLLCGPDSRFHVRACFHKARMSSVRFPRVALGGSPLGVPPRVPRAASDRSGLLSQPAPALHGLRRWPALLRTMLLPSTRMSSELTTRPLPAHAGPVSGSSCCLISKDHPSVVPKSPSPLPGRASLHVPSPVGRYASRLFRPRGFTPPRRLSPRRSCPHCCSGSRPWGSPSFHEGSTMWTGSRRPQPRIPAIPVVHFCPSKLSLRRWLSRQVSELAVLPLRFSAPVRGGLLLLPGRHPALLLLRSTPPRSRGAITALQP